MTPAAFGTQRCADKSDILDPARNFPCAEPQRHRGGTDRGQPRDQNRIGTEYDEKIIEWNGPGWPARTARRCQSQTAQQDGDSIRSSQGDHDDRKTLLHGEDEINHLHDRTACDHDNDGQAPSGNPGGDGLTAPSPRSSNTGQQSEIDLHGFGKFATKRVRISPSR